MINDQKNSLNHQNKNLPNSWSAEEINRLAQALTFAYKAQNTYKEPLDLKDRVTGWQFVLEEDFTMDQVLFGIKKHMKCSPNMPVPANIIQILNPEPPRITEAQFVEAQKWQERNNWPMMSDAQDTIDIYRAQEAEKRENFKIENSEIQSIVSGSIKRIESP